MGYSQSVTYMFWVIDFEIRFLIFETPLDLLQQ